MRTRHINALGSLRHVNGWKKDRPDHRDHIVVDHSLMAGKPAPLPHRVDLRHICCPRIEDQGDIGSCTANSATSAMESLYIKAGKKNPELSRIYLYWVSRVRIEGAQPTDDTGCEIRDVVKALARYGTCLESLWPYDPARFGVTPSAEADTNAKLHQILKYVRAPSLHSIQQTLALGFPLVGGFSVPENMMSDECATTGVVKMPSPDEAIVGGHAVLFVGYDATLQQLIFANSWGPGWGRKGFGYLPFDFVEQRLADDFWSIRLEEM